MYIVFDVENNDEDSEFKVSECVRILNYKHIFANIYTPI